MEPVTIPKAEPDVVCDAVTKAVEAGRLWLVNGPASILAEPIPAGILGPKAVLREPPPIVAAAEILPENLPDAWTDETATALSIATALSQKTGQNLPWKTVKDVITASLNARFTELEKTSGEWPCEYPAAQSVTLKVAKGGAGGGTGGTGGESKHLVAEGELDPGEIQDLGDVMPQLTKIKASTNTPIRFHVRVEVGDGKEDPREEVVQEINTILENLKKGLRLH